MVRELIQKGWAEQQAGRTGSAKQLYKQALSIDPRQPDALNLLGVLALEERDFETAATFIRKAVEAQPSNPGFHANLGQACLELQQVGEAHAAFRRAAKLDPRNPQFAVGAAVCLALQGDVAKAEELLRSIARKHPRYALAWYNLGNVLRDSGRPQEAADGYREAIRVDPAFPDPYNDLGRILRLAQDFDGAEQAYRSYLALAPGSVAGRVNLASLLTDRGNAGEAAAVCRQGIALLAGRDGTAELQWLLGSALVHQGDFVSALAAFGAMDPRSTDPRAWRGRGVALLETGKTWEALRCLEQARQLEGHSADAGHALAGVYLAVGNLQGGWREYVHRPARQRFVEKLSGVNLAGDELGSPKTVLLLREQGLGDELFFLRFAAELRARGATLTYRAHDKLAPLLGRVAVLDRVITGDTPPPDTEQAILVGDLPRLLGGLRGSQFSGEVARAGARHPVLPKVFYPEPPPPLALSALPQQLADLKARLASLGSPPYVGLTWRAGTAPEQQKGTTWMLHKEIPLERFGAALRGASGTLLALQRAPLAGEIERLSGIAGRAVHDLTALNEDLEAMLALLALIDNYVGVSNTNMHLRAGVGRTASVLVPRPAEWRWLAAGTRSPWFPGFRIYRQAPDGSWSRAFELLERDLAGAAR